MVDAEYLTPLIAAGAGWVFAGILWFVYYFKMATTKKEAREAKSYPRNRLMKKMTNASGISLGVSFLTLSMVIMYVVLLAGAGRVNHDTDDGDLDTGDRVNVEWIRYACYTIIWPLTAWLVIFILREISDATAPMSRYKEAVSDYGDWPIFLFTVLAAAMLLIGSLLPSTDNLFWIPAALGFVLMLMHFVIVAFWHGAKWYGANSFFVLLYVLLTAWLLILIGLSGAFGGVILNQTVSRWLFAGTEIFLYVVLTVSYLAWNMRYLTKAPAASSGSSQESSLMSVTSSGGYNRRL